jgi:hypothetical protein
MVALCVESMSAITEHLHAMERRLDALLVAESRFFAVSYNECREMKIFYEQPVSWDEIKRFFLGLKTHVQNTKFDDDIKTVINGSVDKKVICEKMKGGSIMALSFSSTPYIEITYTKAQKKYVLMHVNGQIDLTTIENLSATDGAHSKFTSTIDGLAKIFNITFSDIKYEYKDGEREDTYDASHYVGGLLAACFP